MAGLSHNPAAPYCTKRSGGAADPEARCDYCDSRGLGPAEAEQAAAQPDKPPIAEAEQAAAQPDKPPIAQFFERIGIVKGGTVADIRTVDGHVFAGAYEIVDIAGMADHPTGTLEAVITLRERGTAGGNRIVWSKVCSFTS